MFRDVPGLLFAQDGVSPDFVRAGEPRLKADDRQDDAAPTRASSPVREPLLSRAFRPSAA